MLKKLKNLESFSILGDDIFISIVKENSKLFTVLMSLYNLKQLKISSQLVSN